MTAKVGETEADVQGQYWGEASPIVLAINLAKRAKATLDEKTLEQVLPLIKEAFYVPDEIWRREVGG